MRKNRELVENGQDGNASGKSTEVASQGLSQFIAKVLEQLKLSSWLPAAMLVGCSSVILQLHSQRNLDIGAALIGLTSKPLGILIVLIFSVVLTAVVCQAFSFGSIKALEGYWGKSGVGGMLFALGVSLQQRKRRRVQGRMEGYRRRAFRCAREAMLETEIPRAIIDILESEFYGRKLEKEYTSESVANAKLLNWESYSAASLLGRIERLNAVLNEFPDPHRLLPTKLGNVMRSCEDRLTNYEGSLKG